VPGLGVADLWYEDSSEPLFPKGLPLPDWARFVASLAAKLSSLPSDAPTTAVITVPTRDYAAALAAAAITIGRDELHPSAPGDLGEHLEVLLALPVGTPVQYREPNGKVFQGRWVGFGTGTDGLERVSMELRKGERRSVLVANAVRIVPTGEAHVNGKLRVQNIETSSLLRGLRGDEAAVPFVTTARCEVIIVGVLSTLHEEMCEQSLFISSDADEPQTGYLQDLARVQQFAGATRYFRTVVVSASSKLDDDQRDLRPHVVIYDGGRMFLQCGHLWPGSHRMIILDRSLTSSEDAALEIGQDYGSRNGDSSVGEDLPVPNGIEFVAFRY
jgi:hypothetical protein